MNPSAPGDRRDAPRSPSQRGETTDGRSGAIPLGRLVVVGVGLIGGSCALALKAAGAVREVVGVGRTRGNLDEALSRGIVERAYTLDEPWTTCLLYTSPSPRD